MKPPRRWLAFLLNLILAPAGYAYAGAVRLAVVALLVLLAAAIALLAWTVVSPPGVYADPLGLGPLASFGMAVVLINLCLATHAAILAGRPGERPTGWRLWVIILALAATPHILAELARQYGPLSFYSAASNSMQPSLAGGDIIAVRGQRALCGRVTIAPGDVVVYRRRQDPDGPPWLKRIVAVAGQTVEMRDGRLVIDGRPVPVEATGRFIEDVFGEAAILRETLPNGAAYEIVDADETDFDTFSPMRVPASFVFVLGDNRDNSIDSRTDGAVPLGDVCSVAFKILQARDKAHIGRRP